MKYTLRAAIAALSIGGIPPAMAGEGGSNPNTGWLFPPIGNYLNQRAS